MSIKRHLYDQFRLPRGPLGRLAGRIMSRRSSNVERSRWTVDLLGLPPDARVLELGYGPGLGIEAALDAVPRGEVVGIDHSATMRAMATKRNATAVRAGRATLLVGDAQEPPPDIGEFDAVFSCNVWLFWSDPDATIGRLVGLLAPAGTLAITHLPRHGSPTPADTERAAEQIEQQMHRAGLTDVERTFLPLDPAPAVCVTCRRPTATTTTTSGAGEVPDAVSDGV
jgi:ubiquinone/menaquinone biosynthesis C-methylase UbiE